MKLVQVDAIDSQIFKTLFAITSQTVRTSVQVTFGGRLFNHSALGRYKKTLRVWMKGFRDKSLVPTRSVRSRGVNQVNPQLEGSPEDLLPVFPGRIGPKIPRLASQTHRAIADSAYLCAIVESKGEKGLHKNTL